MCGRTKRSTARNLESSSCPTIAVRLAGSPDDTLLDFLQSTYEAAATLANWDRQSLEWPGDPDSGPRGRQT